MTELMYSQFADYWPLLSPLEEYAEEAALFKKLLLEHGARTGGKPRTLLELGSGGGSNAHYLKADFELTLVDLSEGMLRQSRKINPELLHHCGDMRDVRLEKRFDAVFIHDAIEHMTSREDLRRALTTAYVHCRSGGVALFAPDETKERYCPHTSCGGTDDGRRGFRYLEWSWDPDPSDELAVVDYAFLIRDESGQVRSEHDRHLHGLFPRKVWLDTLTAVGFEADAELCEHSELEAGYELFIGVKP